MHTHVSTHKVTKPIGENLTPKSILAAFFTEGKESRSCFKCATCRNRSAVCVQVCKLKERSRCDEKRKGTWVAWKVRDSLRARLRFSMSNRLFWSSCAAVRVGHIRLNIIADMFSKWMYVDAHAHTRLLKHAYSKQPAQLCTVPPCSARPLQYTWWHHPAQHVRTTIPTTVLSTRLISISTVSSVCASSSARVSREFSSFASS
jgi:hypothetical protein